jgi:putative isomerase
MTFDLRNVPFSRFGSYMAFSHLAAQPGMDEGLYLRTVHGGVSSQILFRIEVLDGDTAIPFIEDASPTVLRLVTSKGSIELCFAESKVIRVHGDNIGLQMTRMPLPTHEGWVYDTATQLGDRCWSVNIRTALRQYALTAIHGDVLVDAPWSDLFNEHIRIAFHPSASGHLECAIEEFHSSWQRRDYADDFDACVHGVSDDFACWESQQVDLSEDFSDARRMAAYVNWSCVVAPEGRLTRPAMYMSKNWMDNIWSWDHCFNALSLVLKNPELAWDQFMVMFDAQDEFGALPDYINDIEVVWNFVKPPIHGWTLKRMLERTDFLNTEHLFEAYAPLSRWTNWWLTYRDADGDGLPEYHHGNDSGCDNDTVFAGGVPVESPDLAAFLVIQMDVLAEIADRLGKPSEAGEWRQRADELLERLLSAFWRGDHFVARCARSHDEIDVESLLLYLPILLGPRLPDNVRRHLITGLTQRDRFLTEYGLATESVSSPDYQADGYWRGPIWAPSTMLLVDGLNAVGEVEFARELSKRFCAMVARSGMAENFDALSGDGLRDRAYSWTSSVFLVLGHEFCT